MMAPLSISPSPARVHLGDCGLGRTSLPLRPLLPPLSGECVGCSYDRGHCPRSEHL